MAIKAWKEATTPPEAAGKARASCIEVTTYVVQSASMAARKTERYIFSPDLLARTKTRYPIRGPAMPMEKMLAPRVVKPP